MMNSHQKEKDMIIARSQTPLNGLVAQPQIDMGTVSFGQKMNKQQQMPSLSTHIFDPIAESPSLALNMLNIKNTQHQTSLNTPLFAPQNGSSAF